MLALLLLKVQRLWRQYRKNDATDPLRKLLLHRSARPGRLTSKGGPPATKSPLSSTRIGASAFITRQRLELVPSDDEATQFLEAAR